MESTRREMLTTAGLVGTAAALTAPFTATAAHHEKTSPFTYCLNTSTVRGQNLTIEEEVDLCAKAGYDGIEPWMRKIAKFTDGGGQLKDLGKRIEDHGLTVESAIGFANWIVDDDAKRAKGLEDAKRDMDVLAQLGAKRIAAPPAGANNAPTIDLFVAAERYRKLLEVGDEMGVVPQVEVWGFSSNLSRLGESMFVALESGHPKACLLSDVYHIYKGGSLHAGLNQLSAQCLQVMHMNDYPADPPREKIGDADRVYPGDGVAPLDQIIQDLHATGGTPVLSLELFNKTYWKQDALKVAQTGLKKMKAAVAKALA